MVQLGIESADYQAQGIARDGGYLATVGDRADNFLFIESDRPKMNYTVGGDPVVAAHCHLPL
ncbi:MAG TPA: hypothetical protein EYN70_00680 [Planctomycetaceae bacterium]|nr:hypothetical protein [Planctomycetaceae bacterium]